MNTLNVFTKIKNYYQSLYNRKFNAMGDVNRDEY